jgi:hypothetical protein
MLHVNKVLSITPICHNYDFAPHETYMPDWGVEFASFLIGETNQNKIPFLGCASRSTSTINDIGLKRASHLGRNHHPFLRSPNYLIDIIPGVHLSPNRIVPGFMINLVAKFLLHRVPLPRIAR